MSQDLKISLKVEEAFKLGFCTPGDPFINGKSDQTSALVFNVIRLNLAPKSINRKKSDDKKNTRR